MAGQGDRTFLLGDMTDNFVMWFILGQVDSGNSARFREITRISDVSDKSEIEQSGKKTFWLVKFAAQRRGRGARRISRCSDRIIGGVIGTLPQR